MTAPAEWLDVATEEPCSLYLGSAGVLCDASPSRAYLQGRRCWEHAPVAITPVIRKENGRG